MRVFFILLFLPIAVECFSQTYVLKGTVVDAKTTEPLAGAGIRSVQNKTVGASTDKNGAFTCTVSPPGDSIWISFIGYRDQKMAITSLQPDSTLTIRLESLAETMQEVVISAERLIAEEFTIKKIRKIEIYTNPSAKADPILAVNATASATTTDESANISLRGGSPDETGIFLNNVPINDAVRYSQLNGIGTFSIFNTALVSSVQVYPGNPPLEFGNSTSGLIALQTDETFPQKPATTASVTLASMGFYHTRKLSERSSLTVFSNYQPSALIRKLNAASLKNIKRFTSLDLGLHYFARLGRTATLKVFNYSLREQYRFAYRQPTYDGIFDQHKNRNFTVANIRKRIKNTEVSLNQGVSFSRAAYRYGTTDITVKLRDLYSSLNIQRLNTTSEWKAGISYERKGSHFRGTFPTFDFAAGENHPVSSAETDDHAANPEAYLYYKRYLSERWIIGTGLRKNIPIGKNKSYLSAQANLHYKATEKLNLNLSAGRYYKYQLPQGETNEPFILSSWQYSADMTCTTTSLEATASVFYKTGTASNTETITRGIELFTRYKLNGNLRCQLSLTSLDAQQTEDNTRKPSPYNIHYFLRGNIEYKILGTWTFTAVFLFRQGSYYTPVSGASYNSFLQVYEPEYAPASERLPAYNTIDFSGSKIFPFTGKSTAIVFLSAGNIANFKNVRSYTYNFDYTESQVYLFSQRTLYFGLILNF